MKIESITLLEIGMRLKALLSADIKLAEDSGV